MKISVSVLVALIFGVFTFSCSKSKSSGGGAISAVYQGPGSRWTVSINAENFTLTQFPDATSTTASLTLSGDVIRNETNRFLTLTVTSSSDEAEVALGTVVTALEIANTAVFIKTPNNPVPLVATIRGACPTGSLNGNWIVTKPAIEGGLYHPANLDADGSGIVSFNPGTLLKVTVAGISNREFDLDDAADMNLAGQQCSNGLLAASIDMGGPEEEAFDMYFTASGLILVKFPEDMGEQVIFAQPRQAASVTGADLEGSYSALLYRGGTDINLSLATLVPVEVVFAADGSATITEVTDVANNTLAGSSLNTIDTFGTTFTADPGADPVPNTNGIFHGELSGAAGQRITCASSVVGVRHGCLLVMALQEPVVTAGLIQL